MDTNVPIWVNVTVSPENIPTRLPPVSVAVVVASYTLLLAAVPVTVRLAGVMEAFCVPPVKV